MSDDLLHELGRHFREPRPVSGDHANAWLEPMGEREREALVEALLERGHGKNDDARPSGSKEGARVRNPRWWAGCLGALIAALLLLWWSPRKGADPLPPYQWTELAAPTSKVRGPSQTAESSVMPAIRLQLDEALVAVAMPDVPVRGGVDVYVFAERTPEVSRSEGDRLPPVMLRGVQVERSEFGALRLRFSPARALGLGPGNYRLHVHVVSEGVELTEKGSTSLVVLLTLVR